MVINTVTVIGANGTQGCNLSAMFASFGNAKVFMVCRTLEKAEKAIQKAVKTVRSGSIICNLIPMDYSNIEKCVSNSDLVFECVSENINTKKYINARIAPYVKENTLVATVTSGLSINTLSKMFPEKIQENYMGLHFFNPPYNMPLCEVIPSEKTDRLLLTEVKKYLKTVLYRTVVEVKDKPAFLGNRIGFQFINEALQYAEKYQDNGGIDYIDAILGQFTGRNMAPIITADFVGLDVHKSIVDNLYKNTDDYAKDSFIFPKFAEELVNENKLGRKSCEGFYKSEIGKDGMKHFLVYDIVSKEYRHVMDFHFPFIEKMIHNLKVGDYEEAKEILVNNNSVEANICLSFLIKYVVYSISTAKLVADSLSDADDVMAAGFNWVPPLAVIDFFGGVENFKELASIHKINLNLNNFFMDIPTSKYDYRKYFKAKH